MLTRSITPTPFGYRLSYAIDGEDCWTEYVPLPQTARPQRTVLKRISTLAGEFIYQLMERAPAA